MESQDAVVTVDDALTIRSRSALLRMHYKIFLLWERVRAMNMVHPWPAQFRLFLQRLNDLPVFDTSRWPAREWGPRLIAGAIVTYEAVHRAFRFPAYLRGVRRMTDRLVAEGCPQLAAKFVGALTVLGTALLIIILLAYLLAFVTRTRAQGPARGFMEVVFPLLVAFLPLLLNGPQTLSRWLAPDGTGFIAMLLGINLLMVGGLIVTLVGTLSLRTSFSLMAEARLMVRSGLFRRVRHPIYTGNFIMLLGVLLLHLDYRRALVYVGVVVGHYFRARLEERKLVTSYPEYAEYQRTTGMFLPRLGSLFTMFSARVPRVAVDKPRSSM
jgi:protein-S-isoprenylcysteine O-methyltransferase Ste14